MKKLMMFAAAMTIVGGAYAACTLPVVSNDCALVYSMKVSAKSTVSKTKVDCDEVCYRNKGSKSLKGYLYVCSCACEDFLDTASLWLEDSKYDQVLEGGIVWSFLNRIGKSEADAEGFWTASLENSVDSESDAFMYAVLYGAGFGKFDSKTGLLKSMSGNVVGYAGAPYCEKDCELGSYAIAYPACDWEATEEVPTAVSGTWSISLNKKLSEKYYSGLWAPGM